MAAAVLNSFHKLSAQTPSPQEKESTETKVTGMGSHLLQGKHPVDQIDACVCGLHFHNGDMKRQIMAHHFCSHRSEEFLQCVIYDTNKSAHVSSESITLLAPGFLEVCPTRKSGTGTVISLKSNQGS